MSTEAEDVVVFRHLVEEISSRRKSKRAEELVHSGQASSALPLLPSGYASFLQNIRAMPVEVDGAGE
jgi:hypothetical protein